MTSPSKLNRTSRPRLRRAYGLSISSELELPELLESDDSNTAADVQIRYGSISRWPKEIEDTRNGIWSEGNQICHYFKDVGAFLVEDGCRITIDPEGDVAEGVLRLSLLGPVMALVLHQRGRFIVHASAVSVEGEAIGFIGAHAWGKSTIATAFHRRGHGLISDDVLAIELRDESCYVCPSFPQLKVWPDAVASLGTDVEALPRVHPEFEKRAIQFKSFDHQSQVLRKLYVLDRVDTAPQIMDLTPSAMIGELIKHWYGARYGIEFLRAQSWKSHFQICAEIATKAAGARLCRPSDLEALDATVDLVVSDLCE
ncbi:MAG: hypothetical protein V3W41_04045 [Planctomycetota bacterium]